MNLAEYLENLKISPIAQESFTGKLIDHLVDYSVKSIDGKGNKIMDHMMSTTLKMVNDKFSQEYNVEYDHDTAKKLTQRTKREAMKYLAIYAMLAKKASKNANGGDTVEFIQSIIIGIEQDIVGFNAALMAIEHGKYHTHIVTSDEMFNKYLDKLKEVKVQCEKFMKFDEDLYKASQQGGE